MAGGVSEWRMQSGEVMGLGWQAGPGHEALGCWAKEDGFGSKTKGD